MSVRVNLLQPHEIQQQTAVSRDFLRRGGSMLGIGLAVLGVAYLGFQYHAARSSHSRLKAQWAAIEGEYAAVKDTADQHAANMKNIQELDAWTRSRVDWEAPLTALQRLVPENLQFTALIIDSDVAISSREPATKEYAGTPARSYTVRIEGTAVGAMSDQDVIAFVETIRESPDFGPWMSQVRLQGMQRAQSRDPDAEEARNFRVHGATEERIMK